MATPIGAAFEALAAAWRTRAGELEAYAPAAAVAFRKAAEELEARVQLAAYELLDRQTAAEEAGVDPDSITRAIRQQRLVNYGTPHSPRVRRADVLAVMNRRVTAADAPASRVARSAPAAPSSDPSALARDALASRLGRPRSA